jgi:hypothetical protein
VARAITGHVTQHDRALLERVLGHDRVEVEVTEDRVSTLPALVKQRLAIEPL